MDGAKGEDRKYADKALRSGPASTPSAVASTAQGSRPAGAPPSAELLAEQIAPQAPPPERWWDKVLRCGRPRVLAEKKLTPILNPIRIEPKTFFANERFDLTPFPLPRLTPL